MLIDNNSLPIIISYLEGRLKEITGKIPDLEAEIEDFEIATRRIRSEPGALFLFLIGYLNYFEENKRIKSLKWEKCILETEKIALQTELEKLKRIQYVRVMYNC